MAGAEHTFWLHTSAGPAGPAGPTPPAAGGCGDCLSAGAGPVCRAGAPGRPCASPELSGDRATLARVLAALNRGAVDAASGSGIVDLQWVKALRIGRSEAELTVTFPARCGGGKQLAEDAFATLRQQLPDTDIYVFHH